MHRRVFTGEAFLEVLGAEDIHQGKTKGNPHYLRSLGHQSPRRQRHRSQRYHLRLQRLPRTDVSGTHLIDSTICALKKN
ncbi:hypothetical protein LINPERPRIM_LOCUS3259 [Linum perenne]